MSTPPSDPYGIEPPFPRAAPPPAQPEPPAGPYPVPPAAYPPQYGQPPGYPPAYPSPYPAPYGQPVGYPPPYGQPGIQPPHLHPAYAPYWQHPMAYAAPRGPKPLQSRLARQIGLGIVALSVLTVIAAVLPWAWVGSRTLVGVSSEVGDGIATIVLAVPCLVLGILRALFKRGSGTSLAAAIVAVVLGALIALTGIGDLIDPGNYVDLTRGPGLWMTAIVGVAMVALGIVGIVKRR